MAPEPIPNTDNNRDQTENWEKAPWMENVAEDIKAARKSGDTEDPVDILFYDPIAIRLTRRFIRMGWTPNAVTLLSLAFGVGGSLLFYPQNRWINLAGIALVIFGVILDCCDGQIARLTHTSSELGRVLDGMVDTLSLLSLYIVLGFRMMKETVPFTDTLWSWPVWILIVVTMILHSNQARMADFYRGLHLFFLSGSNRSNLTRVKTLKEERAALPAGTPFYKRIFLFIYTLYTRDQEMFTPRAQRLLDAMDESGEIVPGLAGDYIARSCRYIQLTNVLSYNLRSYTLFVLILLRLHAFYFPFVIIVMEAIKWFMIRKYEKIAADVYEKYYGGRG